MLIYFGINLLNNHIVDRYFNTVKKINVINDDKGIDYDIDAKNDINFNINPEKKTFTIAEYHTDYNSICVLAFGENYTTIGIES